MPPSLPRASMPSIQGLIAFEAAARHGSFSASAGELALTQSAVSKQVKQLEWTLGAALFQRTRGRVVLTTAGQALLGAARRLLHDYATATHSVMASAGSASTLRLAVLPSFATRWLIPRLPGFLDQHPGITLGMVTAPEPFDLTAGGVDAAIHFGQPSWAEAECIHLCEEAVIAVASPDYARRHRLHGPADLARATLLQQATRPALWRDWFAAAGVDHPHMLRGPLFDQFAMTGEAAKAGMGVALLPAFLVERELAEGSLVGLASPPFTSDGAYYVAVPAGRRHERPIADLVAWLVAEAARSVAARRQRAHSPPIRPGV